MPALSLRGRKHVLEPGVVFTYGPGIPQRILTDPRDRLVKYFVDFAGREAGPLLARSGLRPGSVVRTSVPHEVAGLFEDLIRNGLRGSRWSPAICAALVEHILLKISETSRPTGARETMAYSTYERCRRVLEEGFLGFRSQGDVARACRVDPAYLCRLFRRFGHQSPYRLLLRLKMAHAARLLEAPGALVKEVAGALGFSDPYHFSRTFKRVFGASPRRLAELGHRG